MNLPAILKCPLPSGELPPADRLAWHQERLRSLVEMGDAPEIVEVRKLTEQRIAILEKIVKNGKIAG